MGGTGPRIGESDHPNFLAICPLSQPACLGTPFAPSTHTRVVLEAENVVTGSWNPLTKGTLSFLLVPVRIKFRKAV